MSQAHDGVEPVAAGTVRRLATAALFAALAAALAQVSIPLPGGVPFSVQPFAVFLAGIVLGPLWGGFALALYVLAGVAGAPVFSNGSAGLGYVFGPTGGFLLGFLLAAVVIGAVVHRSVEPGPLGELSVPATAVGVSLGLVPIYAVGVPWLSWASGAPLPAAAASMAPFAATDLVKAGLTVALVSTGRLAELA